MDVSNVPSTSGQNGQNVSASASASANGNANPNVNGNANPNVNGNANPNVNVVNPPTFEKEQIVKRILDKLKTMKKNPNEATNRIPVQEKIDFIMKLGKDGCGEDLAKLKKYYDDKIKYVAKFTKNNEIAIDHLRKANDIWNNIANNNANSIQYRIDLNKARSEYSLAIILAEYGTDIFYDAYLERVKFFYAIEKYYWSYYDCTVLMAAQSDYSNQVSKFYINSCLRIGQLRLIRMQQKYKSSDKKDKNFFGKRRIPSIRIASKFLELAEIENAVANNPEEQKKVNSVITSLRHELCYYKMHNDDDIYEQRKYILTNVYDNVTIVDNMLNPKRNFPENDTVFFERPCAFYGDNVMHYCGWCCRKVSYQFVPCNKCTEVVYCNLQCRAMASKSHSKICGFSFAVANQLSISCQLVYQLLSNQDDIQLLCKNFNPTNYEMKDCKNSWPNIVISATLKGHMKKELFDTDEEESQVLLQAFQLAQIVTIKWNVNDPNQLIVPLTKCIFVMLFNHYISPFTDGKFLKVSKMDRNSKTSQIYAHGIFGYDLRHSCNPNVKRRLRRCGFIAYKAIRKVEEGKALTVNYGVNNNADKITRRDKLAECFGFRVCSCDECTDPNPKNELSNEINFYKRKLARLAEKMININSTLDRLKSQYIGNYRGAGTGTALPLSEVNDRIRQRNNDLKRIERHMDEFGEATLNNADQLDMMQQKGYDKTGPVLRKELDLLYKIKNQYQDKSRKDMEKVYWDNYIQQLVARVDGHQSIEDSQSAQNN